MALEPSREAPRGSEWSRRNQADPLPPATWGLPGKWVPPPKKVTPSPTAPASKPSTNLNQQQFSDWTTPGPGPYKPDPPEYDDEDEDEDEEIHRRILFHHFLPPSQMG